MAPESAGTGAATRTVVQTLGALALLQALLPVDLAVTAVALARRPRGTAPRPLPSGGRRTVLVSGGKMTKSLVLARAFHAAGHRVVMVETRRYRLTGHRFSRAVDAFHVVPDAADPAYADALLDVCAAEGVDVYVPVCSPAASVHDADAKPRLEAAGVEVVHLDPVDLRTVDDKHAFAVAAAELGLPVPDTHRVTSVEEALQVVDRVTRPDGPAYVLKSIAYDPIRRLDLTPLPRPTRVETEAFVRGLPISADSPWILQELLAGTEYCTHGTARDGRLQVHVCCRSSAVQLNYEMVDRPDIRDWVERFVFARGLTGQVSLDFLVGEDGVARAIECNPRTHSAITLLADDPRLAAAYLEDGGGRLEPPLRGRPTHWTHHELWLALRHPRTAPGRVRTLLRGTDAVYDRADPLPFLMLHHVHLPSLMLQNLRHLRPWLRWDVNIGKLVEPGGD